MLHYYDKIDLFKPSNVSPVGYRLYSDSDLETLQQILFFKELDFSLKDIKSIINSPLFDKEKALKSHKELLSLKKKRLERLIKLIDKILKGDVSMDFNEFDSQQIESLQKQYAQEASELYSQSESYREFEKKTSTYSKNDWDKVNSGIVAIFKKFSGTMKYGENSTQAQTVVDEWKKYISENFYSCNNDILRCLGELYVQDTRFAENIDKVKPGLSAFISKAIEIYCKEN